MSFRSEKPVKIVYSHPVEYNALAAELWRRDIPLSLINPAHLSFDPADINTDLSLLLNDLSHPPGFRADENHIRSMVLFSQQLETGPLRLAQSRVINSSIALDILSSKVRQISLFESSKVRYPRTIIANSLDALVRQLSTLRFPILIKDDSYASLKPTLKFDSVTEFVDAIFNETFIPGPNLFVVQEYHQPESEHIFQVDILNGTPIASRKVRMLRDPEADWALELKGQFVDPHPEILTSIDHIARAGRIDLATVEYFIDHRSGEAMFFNILPFSYSRKHDPEGRTLSSIGDYIERRLQKIREIELAI